MVVLAAVIAVSAFEKASLAASRASVSEPSMAFLAPKAACFASLIAASFAAARFAANSSTPAEATSSCALAFAKEPFADTEDWFAVL